MNGTAPAWPLTHDCLSAAVLTNMASNQAGVYRGGAGTGTTGTGTSTDRNAPAGTLRNTTGTAGTGAVSAERGEPICDQKYYTKVRLASLSDGSVQRLQKVWTTLSSVAIPYS